MKEYFIVKNKKRNGEKTFDVFSYEPEHISRESVDARSKYARDHGLARCIAYDIPNKKAAKKLIEIERDTDVVATKICYTSA